MRVKKLDPEPQKSQNPEASEFSDAQNKAEEGRGH
jgi:hypothetical protein